jgi:hypothetical protein
MARLNITLAVNDHSHMDYQTAVTFAPVAITLIATAVNVFFVYKNYQLTSQRHQAYQPVVDIKLDGLPPYNEPADKTLIKLKNVGQASTTTLDVNLSCSWMPTVSYTFNFPTPNFILAPNEEIIWRMRLDQNYKPGDTVRLKVIDRKGTQWWELHEQIG